MKSPPVQISLYYAIVSWIMLGLMASVFAFSSDQKEVQLKACQVQLSGTVIHPDEKLLRSLDELNKEAALLAPAVHSAEAYVDSLNLKLRTCESDLFLCNDRLKLHQEGRHR